MELLETNDPKSELLRKAARHKENIEGEVDLISENAKKTLTNALIIGGTLAVSYLIVRQLAGGKQKKKKLKHKYIHTPVQVVRDEAAEVKIIDSAPHEPSLLSKLSALVASQAGMFILGLAKDKIAEFLQNVTTEEAEEKEQAS